MNILVVTTKSPWPLSEGRALRTYNLLRQAAKNHNITLCTFVQSQTEIDGLDEMRKFCGAVHAVPLYISWPKLTLVSDAIRELFGRLPLHAKKYDCKRMAQLIDTLLADGEFDVVHLDMLHLAEFGKINPRIPVVLVEHNVESQILQRRLENESSAILRAYLRYQVGKLRRYEVDSCNYVDHVVTVSDDDRQQLKNLGVLSAISAVPNAVDVEYFQPGETQAQRDTLIYVGSLAWFPNEDAIRYFVLKIFPILQQRVPSISLKVIGHIPDSAKIPKLQKDGDVEFLGFVEDIRPHVQSAAVYIVPLRIGGGTRLKILDALAMGKSLVSTSVGCEGLSLINGKHALIADEPEQFAEAVASLLADPARRLELGSSGRDHVCENFRWESIALGMENVYESATTTSAAQATS